MEQGHEIFDPRFNQTIPPRALIHGLKSFRIWLRIRRENRDHCWKCMALIETAESFLTPRKPSRKRILALSSFKGIL
jgi:hypothetical protein